MHVHPDIAALRSDRAPQRHAQAAMQRACEAWRAEAAAAQMLAELDDFGHGAPLEHCPMLERVFCEAGDAERLMAALSAQFCAALAANPFGHPPFRNAFDGRAASLLLARAGRAQLMLQSREPGAYDHPSVVFSHALRFDAVLGGAAAARIRRLVEVNEGQARFNDETFALAPGGRLALDLSRESLLIDQVTRRVVVLRLLRHDSAPHPSREYHGRSGALLLQSAGDLTTSRQEAMVALLGRLGRVDAAPQMTALALSDADASLRWQALRESLALDTGQGFAALVALARRDGDALASPAGALRAQLIEAHPQLHELEASLCRA